MVTKLCHMPPTLISSTVQEGTSRYWCTDLMSCSCILTFFSLLLSCCKLSLNLDHHFECVVYACLFVICCRCIVAASDIAPYLSLGCVMSGLDNLFSSLWDVKLQTQEMVPGESWHFDVHKLVGIYLSQSAYSCCTSHV